MFEDLQRSQRGSERKRKERGVDSAKLGNSEPDIIAQIPFPSIRKYNTIPFTLSAVDVCLQPVVKQRQVAPSMLAFALARRCQNESAHLELTLQRYASKSFTAESKSNPEALPGIVNAMWAKGINEKALTEAVEYSATALGTHARTGYLIAPVAVLSKNVPNRRSDRISKYLSEMRHRMLEAKVANVLDAALNLEVLLHMTAKSFQYYQE